MLEDKKKQGKTGKAKGDQRIFDNLLNFMNTGKR